MRSTKTAGLLLTSSLVMSIVQPVLADDLLLKNAKLINPQNKSVIAQDILIRDGRISADGKIDPAHPPKIIDASNKWVIPALIDLHVHFSANQLPNGKNELFSVHDAARIMLYCGVGAFLDLANGRFEALIAERNTQRAQPGKFNDEADIFCAGTAFGRWNLGAVEHTPATISDYIEKWHPDVIKLIYGNNTLDTPNLVAALQTAKKSGVKTVVHIGSWQHARDAIEGGATAVTHLFDDEVIPDDLVHLWKREHTVSIPTMAVQCDMVNFTKHPQLLNSPLLTAIEPPEAIASYRDEKHFSKKALSTLQWQSDDIANDMRSLRKLAKAGVTILAGSDTCNQGTFQGFSLHREIKLLCDAGCPVWDALAAATTGASQFLNRPSGINPGDIAELDILDADPIKDISNTQKINAVIHHGVLLDRQKLLNEIKASSRSSDN